MNARADEWIGSGPMPAHCKLRLGPSRPYIVFVVNGVTHVKSAPVVIPIGETLNDLEDDFIEPADLVAPDATTPVVAAETVEERPAPEPIQVPRGQIDFLMGRTHIGTSNRSIVADLYRRMRPHRNEAPAALRKACYRYALETMAGHRALYRDCRF